ncbi:MAG TPA: class I SAM-dependent methyltransferase [bacterium]
MNVYEENNKRLWNELTDVHIRSYGVSEFKKGESTLDAIQLKEMGDIKGKSLLHLQCHFGLDTLSWAREGVIVTGVDFSEKSIAYANQLREELNIEARFICCNVYDLKKHLNEKFDIVYASQGVLCWLKDLGKWAKMIEHFLKTDGIFYIMEHHPLICIFSDLKRGDLEIIHPYFHGEKPAKWRDASPDYSDDTYIRKNPSYEWQWSLSDVVNSLVRAGLRIEFIHEFDKIFYKALPDMKRDKSGWWYLPDYRNKIPLMFTLMARSKSKI